MGKIAKPQRSKKHKKIKAIDPFYVGDRPADIKAFKYNQKPPHEADQEFSRGAREIMRLKNDMKLQSANNKRKRRRANDFGTSAVEVDELDKKVTDDQEPTEVSHKKKRLQERKAKLADKKRQRKEDRFGGFAALKDDVAFGEVAHQPPTFTTKPMKSKNTPPASNAGTKSLLLTKMFHGPSTVCDEDKAKKQERLSMSQKAMLDEERTRVIQLYRDLKQQRNKLTLD